MVFISHIENMKHTHSRPLLPKVASMTTLPIAPSSQQALGTNKRSQHDFSQARADKNSAAFPLDSQPLKSRTMSCIKESRLNELKSRYPKLFSEMFPKNSSPRKFLCCTCPESRHGSFSVHLTHKYFILFLYYERL